MRTGIVAQKLGMTRIFTDDGISLPITVLDVKNVRVVSQRTQERDGYNAVQLGIGIKKTKRVNNSLRGHFSKSGTEPSKHLVEFKVDSENLIDVGSELLADHFLIGQFVDVTGTSIGKGFAGAMKRHNFAGLEATHGVSISHRSHGSTGQCQDPGKVFKGKKMAGHLGDRRTTVQNLKIVSTDVEKGLIFVCGAVPGSAKSYVLVKDAIKRGHQEGLPMPASMRLSSEAQDIDKNKASESSNEAENTEDNNHEG